MLYLTYLDDFLTFSRKFDFNFVSYSFSSYQISDSALHGSDQQACRQQFKDINDVFADPLQEEATGTREDISSPIRRSKRRGKRNHPKGNFRSDSRTPSGKKRSRFVDFDAPQELQTL